METIIATEYLQLNDHLIEWAGIALLVLWVCLVYFFGSFIIQKNSTTLRLIRELEKCVHSTNQVASIASDGASEKFLAYYESYLAKLHQTLVWFDSWDSSAQEEKAKILVSECRFRSQNLMHYSRSLDVTGRLKSNIAQNFFGLVPFKKRHCHLCCKRVARLPFERTVHAPGGGGGHLVKICKRCHKALSSYEARKLRGSYNTESLPSRHNVKRYDKEKVGLRLVYSKRRGDVSLTSPE